MTKTTVGITGPNGFIAKHLRARLDSDQDCDVRLIPRAAWDDDASLDHHIALCDSVIHTAGVNRGTDEEVCQGNTRLAEKLAASLERTGAKPHVVYCSTTQRDNPSPYGSSKLEAEDRLRAWALKASAPLSVLVIPNVYGAGCRPFYNSVVATFCHQLTHNEQPQLLQDREVEFVWVGDLAEQIHQAIGKPPTGREVTRIQGSAQLWVSKLLARLESYRESYFDRHVVPDLTDRFEATLYSTFLSYLDLDDHRHVPDVKADARGELYEVIKTAAGGQVFFSTTKPGVIRGDHYHTRKVEWFCVLKGDAVIRLRPIHGTEVKSFRVSGDRPEFISIPVLHTHHIENVGDTELLTMFWCNELFDQADPDTFYDKVA